jgi:hypothetical protein
MAARQSRTSAKKQHQVTMQPDSSSESGETLSPDELARALRAVAAELERDPVLARRVAGAMRAPLSGGAPPSSEPELADGAAGDPPSQPIRRAGKAFKPKLVTGAAPALGPGVPDPFALREQLGEDGLRAALADLRLGTLRAIVREHRLDPTGQLAGQNDDAKFRALILQATKRGKRG